MKYVFVLGTAFLAVSQMIACDSSPAKVEAEAKEAQRRADQEIERARQSAADKAAEAQAKADAEAKRAREAFDKTRNDLRRDTQRELDELSVKLEELKTQIAKEKGKRKADLELAQKDIIERRDAVDRELKALETTTVNEIEAVKARLTNELAELKKALDKATSKI